ncbi:MAG TPA: S9 family peptidase [Gemmatimonadales bacterium]|nr:S9 family peptidase [Gemmatimonadales bacterium]
MKQVVLFAIALTISTPAWAQRPVQSRDLLRIREVSDPQLSPDGAWVAYTVTTSDTAADKRDSDVWMSRWDGKRSVRLTYSKAREHSPRWSPDGRYLAFLSSREDPREVAQIWLLDRTGGEAERVTDFPGGVSDYAWAPDGSRLAIIASDPTPDQLAEGQDSSKKRPRPIVINRYRFKYDEVGYIGAEREHLHLFTLADRKATLLTPGDYDEAAPSWSPDGRSLAFLSRRRPEYDRTDNWDVYVVAATPGAEPRQLTTFAGADGDPEWGSRAPSWSPDGRLIAYVQGGKPELLYYGGHKLAVVPVDGGPARVLTSSLDRNVLSPVFSRDGASVLFLLEDDRVNHLARVPTGGGSVERLVEGKRSVEDLSLAGGGRIAVTSSTPERPTEVFVVEGRELRKVSAQNDAWLAEVGLAPLEELSVKSRDGTAIHGFVLKPANYRVGTRYPTLLRIHGGPVWQYYHDFAYLEWQVFAAQGYVVVGVNPRGSSGRGEKFATAIFAAWGEKDGDDVLAAVDHLVAAGVADPERLGLGGWSYGGILTNQVIARDRRFKAATSGAGQGNALLGYGTDMYTLEYELELGKPWANLDTWRRVSQPFLRADRIVTPTLFLCGQEDWNVPLINSEQMYQALKSLGRETELVIYPGESHGIGRPSFVLDRMERYLAWYGKYLGGSTAASAGSR